MTRNGSVSTMSKLAVAGCVSAVLVVLGSPQRAVAAECCQCPLPACGIPRDGSCGSQCVLIKNAICDGKSGTCKPLPAYDSQWIAPYADTHAQTGALPSRGICQARVVTAVRER
jgi:hypothetical protein